MLGIIAKTFLQRASYLPIVQDCSAIKIAVRGLLLRNCQTFSTELFGRTSSVTTLRSIQTASLLNTDKLTINIVDRNRKTHTVQANVDDTILNVVIDNELDLESYGVCEGAVACSTCHVIFDQKVFDTLEEPLMEEMDMLDLACGLTETYAVNPKCVNFIHNFGHTDFCKIVSSRLGCQVHLTKEMDGMTVKLPEEITDARDL